MSSVFGRNDYPAEIENKETRPYVWSCTFDRDYCNLKNQYNMATFQRHSDSRSPLFGEMSMLYINVSKAGLYRAARLESEYFNTESQTSACLSIKYLMYGTGAVKLYLIQQDVQNKCIYVDNNDLVDNYGNWREASMTIDLRDGNPRFFFEAHFDVRPPHYGTIAVSKITFSYGICQYDDTNYCRARDEQPIEPLPSAV